MRELWIYVNNELTSHKSWQLYNYGYFSGLCIRESDEILLLFDHNMKGMVSK